MKSKLTRVMSMIFALMMLIGTMPAATAADTSAIEGFYTEITGTSTVAYATDKAYSGNRSIVIDAKGDGYVGMGDPVADFGMDPTKAYGIEFYMYVDSWTSGSIQLKPTGNENNTYPTVYYALIENGGAGLYLNGTNKARWGIEKIESGEKAGWYRIWNKTAIISEDGDYSDVAGYGKGRMWYTDGNMKVYLDNISVYEWTGYTTTQNSGTRGESPILTQDFEAAGGNGGSDGIQRSESFYNLTSGGSTAGVSTDKAYEGSRSFLVDAKADGHVWMGDPVVDFSMDPTKAYGIEFYIYPESWTSGAIELKPTGNDNNTYPTVYYAKIENGGAGLYLNGTNKERWGIEKIESGEKAGWYRVWNKTAIISEDGDYSDVAGYGKGYMWYTAGEMKVYLDNINIYEWTGYTTTQNSGTRGETPIIIQDFEEAAGEEPETPVVPEYPTASDLYKEGVKLTLNPNYDSTDALYGVTNFRAFEGEKSLYVDSTNAKIGLGSANGDFGLVKGTPYGMKFSIYVEENSEGKLQIKPQNGGNAAYRAVYYTEISGTSETGLVVTGACKDRWTITENDGWYTFESIYPIMVENTTAADFLTGQMFNFEGKFKAYIDNIEIYNWTKAPAGGDAIANGMGTEIIGKRDFEDVEIITPSLPDASELLTENIGVTLNPDYSGSKGIYGVTDVCSHSGGYSLYVDSTNGSIGVLSSADDFGLEKVTAYGMKFSIYIAENSEGKLQIKPQNNGNDTYSTVYYTEITGTTISEDGLTLSGNCANRWTVTKEDGEKKGWYTFEALYPIYVEDTEKAAFVKGGMFNFEGKFKAFIDDVEIYDWTKEPAAGAGFANGMGTTLIAKRDFEPIGDFVGSYKKSVSGNTVTVSVDVRNCTGGDNYTAQLFLAVYSGNTLETIVSTDKITIAEMGETDTPATLDKTITVPEGKTMKIFLWDSLEGMRPLKKSETYAIAQ